MLNCYTIKNCQTKPKKKRKPRREETKNHQTAPPEPANRQTVSTILQNRVQRWKKKIAKLAHCLAYDGEWQQADGR